MKTNIPILIMFIVICELAGVIGSIFTTSVIPNWYAQLKKPAFTPPNWLFGPVWVTLYLLMGISAYLVWSKRLSSPQVKTALIIFGIQLILNILWSFLFFGLKSPILGLIDIVALWIFILLTIIKFYPISHWASFLLIPYILWVSLATLLNFFVWRLN